MVSASAATSPLARTVSFCFKFAVRHGRHHLHDAAHLLGKIGRHHVDVVGEVFPSAGHTGHFRLAAQLAVRAHFARHARDFRGEGVELVHHGIDGVLKFQDFAFHVHRDLARQVAARHGGGNLRNVANLGGKVGCQQVDVVREIFPRAAHARNHGLPAQAPVGAHLARHARHLGSKRAKLLHHGVKRFLELQNFAANIHRNLLGKIAIGNGGRHFGNVAHLGSQVARHEIDVIRQVLPRAGHTGDDSLAAQFALCAHLARHPGDFRGKGIELVHHGIDGVFQLQDLTFHVHGDLARKVASSHGRRDFSDVPNLAGQVPGHGVHAVREVLPRARHARDVCLAA